MTSAAAVALGLALAGGSVAAATSTAAPSTAAPSTAAPSPSTASSSAPRGGRPPGGGSPPAAFGTVKSVGDASFTIATSGGTTVTVDVSDSTKYLDHDATTPSFANVTVGQHVAVFGTDTSNVVAATSVAIGAPPAGGPGGMPGGPGGGSPPAAVGTVKSVGDASFTITTSGGTTVIVDVSDSTKYLDHDATTPSFANVTVGQHVAVFGTDTSDVVAATSVAIGAPPSDAPPPAAGGTTGGQPQAGSGSGSSF